MHRPIVSVSTTSGLDFRRGYDVVEWKLKEERIQFQTVEVSLPDPPQVFIDSTMISTMLYDIFHWWYLASFYIGNGFGLPRRSYVLTSCILAATAGLFEESGLTGCREINNSWSYSLPGTSRCMRFVLVEVTKLQQFEIVSALP